ncbi:hypothetical protein V6N11_066013 [Hibiscus sabdariffa]|uniref:Uncharacterized protein n=1 Tax=Hibiscus sabdariffa TaxID=183260 RepID=A0ABR2NUD7_9ROSI
MTTLSSCVICTNQKFHALGMSKIAKLNLFQMISTLGKKYAQEPNLPLPHLYPLEQRFAHGRLESSPVLRFAQGSLENSPMQRFAHGRLESSPVLRFAQSSLENSPMQRFAHGRLESSSVLRFAQGSLENSPVQRFVHIPSARRFFEIFWIKSFCHIRIFHLDHVIQALEIREILLMTLILSINPLFFSLDIKY